MKKAKRTQQPGYDRTSLQRRSRTVSRQRRKNNPVRPNPLPSRKRIFVELATPRGRVFAGTVSAFEFWPASGVVQMEPSMTAYFGLIPSAEVTVRIGKHFRFFAALNASASIADHRLTVMAEVIQPTPPPVRNCANPECTCGDDYERVS